MKHPDLLSHIMQVCTLMKFIEFNLRNQLINVSIIIIVIEQGVYFNQIEFVSPFSLRW